MPSSRTQPLPPGDRADATGRHLEPRRPTPLRLLAALLAMTLAMLVTASIGRRVVLASATIRGWDADVVTRATTWSVRRPEVVDALLVWQALTEPWVLHLALAALAVALFLRGRVRRRALWLTPVGLVAWALAVVAKHVVGRARPAPPEAVTHVDGYSYPSGHATGSTIVMILLVVLLWPLVRPVWRRVLLVVAAAGLVVLTCLDRVLLGVHYPSDVLAGVLVGSVMTTAALLLVLRPAPGPAGGPEDTSEERA